jgi:hypothetical protein
MKSFKSKPKDYEPALDFWKVIKDPKLAMTFKNLLLINSELERDLNKADRGELRYYENDDYACYVLSAKEIGSNHYHAKFQLMSKQVHFSVYGDSMILTQVDIPHLKVSIKDPEELAAVFPFVHNWRSRNTKFWITQVQLFLLEQNKKRAESENPGWLQYCLK